MSKLEAIQKHQPYTDRDGTRMCFVRQTENMSVYQPCSFQQLAITWGGSGYGWTIGLGFVLIAALTWGVSYITARQSQYESLFTSIKRSMGR